MRNLASEWKNDWKAEEKENHRKNLDCPADQYGLYIKSANQSINRKTIQTINQSNNQSINRPFDQSVNRMMYQSLLPSRRAFTLPHRIIFWWEIWRRKEMPESWVKNLANHFEVLGKFHALRVQRKCFACSNWTAPIKQSIEQKQVRFEWPKLQLVLLSQVSAQNLPQPTAKSLYGLTSENFWVCRVRLLVVQAFVSSLPQWDFAPAKQKPKQTSRAKIFLCVFGCEFFITSAFKHTVLSGRIIISFCSSSALFWLRRRSRGVLELPWRKVMWAFIRWKNCNHCWRPRKLAFPTCFRRYSASLLRRNMVHTRRYWWRWRKPCWHSWSRAPRE